MEAMRGYFGIGVEGISKPLNLGNLLRSAHAFGASFAFVIAPAFDARGVQQSDTSKAVANLPFHVFPDVESLTLPVGCQLVGLELVPDAIDLPSFRHPMRAAYVLGAERASLSPALIERCDYVVRIPGRFCINLGVAGAIAMYDRMLSLGRFAERPVRAGGPPPAPPTVHVHGEPIWKKKQRRRGGAPE